MIDMIIASSLLAACTFVVKTLSKISNESPECKEPIITEKEEENTINQQREGEKNEKYF